MVAPKKKLKEGHADKQEAIRLLLQQEQDAIKMENNGVKIGSFYDGDTFTYSVKQHGKLIERFWYANDAKELAIKLCR